MKAIVSTLKIECNVKNVVFNECMSQCRCPSYAGKWEDISTHNSTIKVTFSTIILF